MFVELYNYLYKHYGDLKWWPSETGDETIIGCILTQNTSWKNVEKAIEKMKSAHVDTLREITRTDEEYLKGLIRSSGFYNQKSRYLLTVSNSIIEKYGSVDNMKERNPAEVETFISGLKGVGSETMESIMLYALNYPIFVVDAYTFRIFKRYYGNDFTRKEIRNMAEEEFRNIDELKNFHGMIVNLGKDYCRKSPLCNSCFLKDECKFGMKSNH
jgi:endonuclease-3 related protein